ncbi:class I SAM-dependent methyltransferase [Streptomyces benahoarensis]|uniref:Class I SAM-dependent methyltransferase n=1 Tax=Streptomyces benahoarensis TaxID=2595054 RepID=A0A553YUM9_9ACTN|nr:class I SAM-dependent methyltransferase [Streptomyces benahoarensis]TSB17208.1 class I SAM-dependent methyltransferase [Streptomyces benahoarensis]TSB32922.1 class I SAM-dependent methyltransferase [Streptomyces benahoarensis]
MLSPRLLKALERFNATYAWDHNAHYHRWILQQLPRRFDRALDVGSGSGGLARLLAGRAATVEGIDADPVITARARELTPEALPVTYTVADAVTAEGPYDAISCVATIHHLPSDTRRRLVRLTEAGRDAFHAAGKPLGDEFRAALVAAGFPYERYFEDTLRLAELLASD